MLCIVSYSDDCSDGDMTALSGSHGFLSLVPRVAVGWNDVLTTRTCAWNVVTDPGRNIVVSWTRPSAGLYNSSNLTNILRNLAAPVSILRICKSTFRRPHCIVSIVISRLIATSCHCPVCVRLLHSIKRLLTYLLIAYLLTVRVENDATLALGITLANVGRFSFFTVGFSKEFSTKTSVTLPTELHDPNFSHFVTIQSCYR